MLDIDDDIISQVGLMHHYRNVETKNSIISKNNSMNNIVSNIAFFTLATGSLGGVVTALQSHDYPLAAGLLVFGLIMVWVYEKTPPTAPNA